MSSVFVHLSKKFIRNYDLTKPPMYRHIAYCGTSTPTGKNGVLVLPREILTQPAGDDCIFCEECILLEFSEEAENATCDW